MIKNLSPSRASQFKTCPMQFKYANVYKIKEPTNEVQAKGTTVHEALEKLYDLPQDERNLDNLHNLFRKVWTDVRNNDEHVHLFDTQDKEREWGIDGLKLLSNYFTLEDPTKFEPLERERWVRGAIDDLNLRGILDRMDKNEKGELIIVDYKSGKAPIAKYKEPRFFALKLYALLIKDEIGETPAELKLIYLQNSTIHSMKVDDEMLENARIEILEIWNNIKESFKKNDFPTIKNTLCDWCYYKPICPEFNSDSSDTEELEKCNNSINEINETIEAVNLLGGLENLPENSPLKNTDLKEINKELEELENKKDMIVKEIENLLRK
jgi:putative RecB family exonuclease